MSKTKHLVSIGCKAIPLVEGVLILGIVACSADSTFSSSSNWLKCRTNDECVAAFGEGSCSSNQICVDENNQPIPRDRQSIAGTTTDAGAESNQRPTLADSSPAAQEPSGTTSDASTPTSLTEDADVASAATTDDAASFVSADAGPMDAPSACAAGCSQTDPFVLPLALCEDWNVFRDGQLYEFCDPLPTGSCRERCTAVVTGSSTECSESLPAVIACVAADGFYNDGPSAPPVMGCLFPACQAELLHMASACSRLTAEWRAAKDLWLQSGVTAYRFQFAESTIQVNGDEVAVIDGERLDSPPSVADLFDTIEASLDTPERPIIVTYDTTLGYPTRLRSYDLVQAAGCATAAETVVSEFTIE